MAYEPRRPLNWNRDPAYGARDNWRTRTPFDRKAALDYNRRLYAPESEEMRSVLGIRPAPPAGATGWQTPGFNDLEGILSRYGSARGGRNIANGIANPVQSRPLTLALTQTPSTPPQAFQPATETAPYAQMPTDTDSTTKPPAGNERTPFQQAEADWMEAGGTDRTWNRALRKAGVRPRIDARARQSPLNVSVNPTVFSSKGQPDRQIQSPQYLPY